MHKLVRRLRYGGSAQKVTCLPCNMILKVWGKRLTAYLRGGIISESRLFLWKTLTSVTGEFAVHNYSKNQLLKHVLYVEMILNCLTPSSDTTNGSIIVNNMRACDVDRVVSSYPFLLGLSLSLSLYSTERRGEDSPIQNNPIFPLKRCTSSE